MSYLELLKVSDPVPEAPGPQGHHPWLGCEVQSGDVWGILRVIVLDSDLRLRAGIRAEGGGVLYLRNLADVALAEPEAVTRVASARDE